MDNILWITIGTTTILIGTIGVYYLRGNITSHFKKRQKVQRIKTTPFHKFRDEVVELIMVDNAVELEELLTLIFQFHPSHNISEITHHRNNGGLLALSCRLGRVECVKILLQMGANCGDTDANDETSLHFSAKNGKIEVMKILLDAGANPNARNFNGWSPLHWTATNGRHEGTKLLLKHGGNIDVASYEQLRTPLHFAVQNGHYEDTKALLEHGANISVRDVDGNTPILACGKNGSLRILELLLSYNANLNDRNNLGFTPLLRAADRGLSEFVITLLKKDSKYCMEQLVSVVDCISKLEGQGQADSAKERQLKLSSVLKRVVQIPEFVDPFLQLMSEKIYSIAIKLLDEPSIISKDALHNGTLQLIWLIEFIGESEPEIGKKTIPKIIQCLDKLWIRIDKSLVNYSLLENCNTEIILTSICPVVRMYHKIVQSTLSCEYDEQKLQNHFQEFVDKHSDILWKVIKTHPDNLTTDLDFALLTQAKSWNHEELNKMLTFDRLREWLNNQIEESQRKFKDENVTINVRRGKIGEQSCSALLVGEGSIFKGKFNIIFEGEEASGAGVRREWFAEISRDLFDPNNALFLQCHDGTLQPNPVSSIHLDHLSYFRFAGRLIGLAIYHSELINAHFTRSFYKHILGIPPSYRDFESSDPTYFKNLENLLSLDNIEDLELTFSSEEFVLGKSQLVELIDNGSNIPVTKDNIQQYIQLLTELKMTKAIEFQIQSFLQGLYEIIPHHLLRIFNEYQLELLISGIPTIDPEDWKNNTKYNQYSEDDKQIIWFWEIVNEYPHESRAALLQFATGTSNVPAGGFACLKGHEGISKFTILKTEEKDSLPTSGTCFNLLRLPCYENKDIMKEKLTIAISSGSRGFTFA